MDSTTERVLEELKSGLTEYHEKGNQDRLTHLVDHVGEAKNVDVLYYIAKNPFDGQEAFVKLVVHSDWVLGEDKTQLLRLLANSTNEATREEVILEVLSKKGSIPFNEYRRMLAMQLPSKE